MSKKILAVNPGSASRKYAFFEDGREKFSAHFETENGGYSVEWAGVKGKETQKLDEYEYKKSAEFFVKKLVSEGVIASPNEISAIGFRVVAPGKYFLATREIDNEFLDEIGAAEERAPLHLSSLISELREIKLLLPEVARYGVSDSAFFADKFEPSRYYGIDRSLAEELHMYRYGYHGISASYISGKMPEIFGKTPKRAILCHLGSGVSIIAVKDGKGFDASMGFTPLEGAVMSTRVGNIDAGALIYLMKRKGFSPDELAGYLNKKCGLLGLSGKSDDMRELIKAEGAGDESSKNAIDVFCYRIRKEIGSMAAAMGGVDAVIFTATMGERSNIVRERICGELGGLGIVLDKKKNDTAISRDTIISDDRSPVPVAVIGTDEMAEIERETSAKL